MALTAGHVHVQFRGVYISQVVMCSQWYRTDGAAFLTANPASLGEALWNDVKTLWRAIHAASSFDLTTSLLVSEPGALGAYGEYAVPSAEQQGSRNVSALGDFQAPHVAASFRQTVATRATRPGQKRMWGLMEGDVTTQDVNSGYLALLSALAVKFSSFITLGAPVALGVLYPEIVRLSPDGLSILEAQDVDGFVVNQKVTTQNSRKFGRGI